jgi:hypothetical protein
MTLRSAILLSAAVIGLSLANLPDAKADLCFRYGSGGGTQVAKGAKLPEPGTCQPLALYEVEPGGRAGAANGMICRDGPGSGGLTIIFHYTYDACTGGGSYFESATCRLELSHVGPGTLPTVGSSCRGTFGHAPSTPNPVPLKNFADSTLKLDDCGGVDTTVPGGAADSALVSSGFRIKKRNLSGPVERVGRFS